MKKKIGIIGISGRMGMELASALQSSQSYELGIGFDSSTHLTLNDVLKTNDYVVDFSSAALIKDILETAIQQPKPLLLCSTGWDKDKFVLELKAIAKAVPVIIAPNTSLGACMQQHLVALLARALGLEYDIDIMEQHHKGKLDVPSGTARALVETVKEAKRTQGIEYHSCAFTEGQRPNKCILLSSLRSGSLPGEHCVSFTSADEIISIKHVAFNRSLFARGAMLAVQWLDKSKASPGIYTMTDVLGIKHYDVA
jgi:4-hydroxy-tetrahydrodipicolinate reductase